MENALTARALEHVRMMAGFGPKVVGSRANEVLTVGYLTDTINKACGLHSNAVLHVAI